jgi:hypothetical protein
MTTTKALVDRDFVKSLETMRPHEIEAVDALYPGVFDKAVEDASARFEGRAVESGQADAVRRHLGALVVSELWKRLGTKDADIEYRVTSAKSEAEEWLKQSQTIDAARASTPAGPTAFGQVSDPFPAPPRVPTMSPHGSR